MSSYFFYCMIKTQKEYGNVRYGLQKEEYRSVIARIIVIIFGNVKKNWLKNICN